MQNAERRFIEMERWRITRGDRGNGMRWRVLFLKGPDTREKVNMVPLTWEKKWDSGDRYFTFKYRSGSRYSDAKYHVVRDLAFQSTACMRMDTNDEVTENLVMHLNSLMSPMLIHSFSLHILCETLALYLSSKKYSTLCYMKFGKSIFSLV